jgi:hypothetical protein
MEQTTNLMTRCKIKGLKLTPSSVRKVKNTIEYNFIQLDSLLLFHQEKIHPKLFDDNFFRPETLDVFEYKGESYVVEAV